MILFRSDTKEEDTYKVPICRFCGAELPHGVDKIDHEKYCLQNPHDTSCYNCGNLDCEELGILLDGCEFWRKNDSNRL